MRFSSLISFGGILICSAAVAIALVATRGVGGDEETRRAELQNLSLTEQDDLRRKSEAFESLDPSEQQRMRELHVAIATSPDSDRLQSVMLQYHEWLKTLTGKERADLLKLPPAERIAEIRRLTEEQRQQRFRNLVRTPLPSEDVRAIFGWLDLYALNHEEELLAMLSETTRQRISQASISGPLQRKMMMMALGSRGADVQLPSPSDEELQKLDENLSEDARKALAKLESREQKLQLVREWVRAGLASRMVPQIGHEQLLEFYREYRERTPDKSRVEELDSLPPEEFYEEVRKLYFRSRGHWRGWRDGDRRGPPKHDERDHDAFDARRPGEGPRRLPGEPGGPGLDGAEDGALNGLREPPGGPRFGPPKPPHGPKTNATQP